MRLLICGRSSNAGGGPAWGHTLTRGLIERGHSVKFVFTRIGNRQTFMHKRLAALGVLVEPLCYRYPQQDYPGDLARFIDSWKPDFILIDNHERMAEVIRYTDRIASGASRVVFIAHCHGVPRSYLEGMSPFLWKVICVSQASADLLQQFNPVVIRNAVPPAPESGEDVRAMLGIPTSAFVIGYLGRHDANKSGRNGQQPTPILFDALPGNDHWLLLAGKGSPGPPAELESSVKDRIRVVGREIQFIGDFYRALDVFVLCSKSEGFPLCVSEALLAGCRVASTRVSDLEEVLGPALAFFDHGDVPGMREAILRAPDPSLGQAIIREKLSVEKMLDQYEEALQ